MQAVHLFVSAKYVQKRAIKRCRSGLMKTYKIDMNYELALELKNAGFDQELLGRYDATTFKDGTLVPTLSELIEACGDEFGYLKRTYFGADEKKIVLWTAESVSFRGFDTLKSYYNCSTPEEAVARLYISLNKK